MTGPASADDHLRVGTSEREAAIAALGEHFTAGRLVFDEYEHRLDAVVEARTRSQLREIFVDLPPPYPPLAPAGVSAGVTGPGRLPDDLRAQLLDEGLVVLAEDVPGTMSHDRYRAPGQDIRRSTRKVRGTVAVSRRRLLIWAAGAKRVDMPFANSFWQALEVSMDGDDWLRVDIDVAALGPDRSGHIVIRMQTDQARTVAALLAAER